MKSKYYVVVPIRSSFRIISLVLAVSTILLGVVLFLHILKGIPIGELTRDPAAIGGLPTYTGFLSQIGILLWSASATVCFFSFKVLLRCVDCHELRRLLLISGFLSLLLGLDDVFLLHERVFPYFGVPEKIVYTSYAVFMLYYLFRFYALIIDTEYVLLAFGLFFFGVSVTIDVLHPSGIPIYLFEDGAKLIGLVSWLAYFFRLGEYSVNLNAAQQSVAPDFYPANAP